ncbi:MAG: DNA cytosine methyltransferase [Janthinobacterium lividum]
MIGISLFSNCGAGDVGYRSAGFNFEIMAELERQRLEICQLNHPGAIGFPGDLRETWFQVVYKWLSEHERDQRPTLLCACPPCQGMSSARAGIGKGDDFTNGHDERNLLVEVVAEVITYLKPRMVVLENVPQFLSRLVPHPVTGKGISAPRLLQERIGRDYHFFPILVDLADYGVPQSRKRAFITLVRKEDSPWLSPMLDAGRLPFPVVTHAGRRVTFERWFQQHELPELDPVLNHAAPNDLLHAVSKWEADDRRWAMIKATASNGGSAWDNTRCEAGHDNPGVPDDAIWCTHAECQRLLLRPIVQDKDGSHRLIKGFRSSSYRRMRADQVASTVTTASGHIGSDINIHPSQHRLLSPRECASLQTFPDDFKWGPLLERGSLGKIREMIGEAVPPLFTEAHGRVLASLLNGTVNYDELLPVTDERAVQALERFEADPTQPVPTTT